MAFEHPVSGVDAEYKPPERPRVELPSFERHKAQSQEKIGEMKDRFNNFRTNVRDRFSSLYKKAKGAGTEALHTAMAVPGFISELPQYGIDKATEAYQSASDFVQGKVNETRFNMSKSVMGVMDMARGKFNAIENKALRVGQVAAERASSVMSRVQDRLHQVETGNEISYHRARVEALQELLKKADDLGLHISRIELNP